MSKIAAIVVTAAASYGAAAVLVHASFDPPTSAPQAPAAEAPAAPLPTTITSARSRMAGQHGPWAGAERIQMDSYQRPGLRLKPPQRQLDPTQAWAEDLDAHTLRMSASLSARCFSTSVM